MTFEVGQRVRVLPGARSDVIRPDDDFYPDVAGDKTVIILETRTDGDFHVEDSDTREWYFLPEFLELVEPEVEINKGDRVRVTKVVSDPDDQYTETSTVEGTVLFGSSTWVDFDGKSILREGATVEILEKAKVAPKVGDVVESPADLPLGTLTREDDFSGPYLRTKNGWVAKSGQVFPNVNHVRGTIIVYLPEEDK